MVNGILITDQGVVAVVGQPKPTKELLDSLVQLFSDLKPQYLQSLAESLDDSEFKSLVDARGARNANESELPNTES